MTIPENNSKPAVQKDKDNARAMLLDQLHQKSQTHPLSVSEMVDYLFTLAWKLDGEHIKALTQAKDMIQSMAPIPEGVYYSKQSDNFYMSVPSGQYRKGLSQQFYHQWVLRAKEFPETPNDNLPTDC